MSDRISEILNGIKIYDGVYKKEKPSLDKFIGCSLDNTL